MSNKKPIQTKLKYGQLVILIAIIVMASACIKDRVNSLDNNILYEPYFSLPVGTVNFELGELMGSGNFDTIPVDTISPDDSTFTYNDKRYRIPDQGYFDTTFVEIFSFSDTEDWVNYVTFLMLRLNMTNTIPSELLLQVSFLDANQSVLFNIFDAPGLVIPAAENNVPIIISPYDSDPLTEGEIMSIPFVRFVRTSIAMNIRSTETGTRYESTNYFNTQMGFRIGLQINTRE